MKMTPNSEFSVTLSNAMWKHLRSQAAALGVSVELLVAGLVCDTIDCLGEGNVVRKESTPGAGWAGLLVE
jgi:hypothetical protein